MSTTEISIDAGSLLDIDAVMAVMDDSFDAAFGEAWTAPQCAGLIPMTGVWLTLARRGPTVIGFSLSRIVLREAELLLLAVRRGAQRSGAGRALLQAFLRNAAVRGADQVHLEVRDGNAAVNLYADAGFSQVGRRPAYYRGIDGQVYDALTFTRTVAD